MAGVFGVGVAVPADEDALGADEEVLLRWLLVLWELCGWGEKEKGGG